MARARLRRLVAGLILGALLVTQAACAAEPPAAASEPESSTSFGDRFFRGTTPGELPSGKLALVAGLYTGAAASVGVGIASLLSWRAKHHDAEAFKYDHLPGFCNDLASSSCASYRRLLSDERSARESGFALLGLGGVLALGGALTAQIWPNSMPARVALSLEPTRIGLGVTGDF